MSEQGEFGGLVGVVLRSESRGVIVGVNRFMACI